MRKIISILLLVIITISCQSEKEKQLNEKSLLIFNNSVEIINKSLYKVSVDSFRIVYEDHKSENPQTGLDFAIRFQNYANKLLKKREDVDVAELLKSAANRQIEEAKNKEREVKNEIERIKALKNSKYGKLQLNHPNWTDEECEKIVRKKIWIGMTYDMLLYQRGKPNSVNPSNYGSGTQYQCCWDDYTPSCFYMKEDNIIYSYN